MITAARLGASGVIFASCDGPNEAQRGECGVQTRRLRSHADVIAQHRDWLYTPDGLTFCPACRKPIDRAAEDAKSEAKVVTA